MPPEKRVIPQNKSFVETAILSHILCNVVPLYIVSIYREHYELNNYDSVLALTDFYGTYH